MVLKTVLYQQLCFDIFNWFVWVILTQIKKNDIQLQSMLVYVYTVHFFNNYRSGQVLIQQRQTCAVPHLCFSEYLCLNSKFKTTGKNGTLARGEFCSVQLWLTLWIDVKHLCTQTWSQMHKGPLCIHRDIECPVSVLLQCHESRLLPLSHVSCRLSEKKTKKNSAPHQRVFTHI